MGWASATDIFNPVAKIVIETVDSGDMFYGTGVAILAELAGRLADGDWDTQDEALEEFDNHSMIRKAFRKAGLLDEQDEREV